MHTSFLICSGCYGGTEFFGRSFTTATWKGLSEVLDLSLISNSTGLEVGHRIFELNDENVTLEIVSLENLLKAFKHEQHTTPQRNGSPPQNSGTGGKASSLAQQKSRNSWIPSARRLSVGSIESFYSATENQDLVQVSIVFGYQLSVQKLTVHFFHRKTIQKDRRIVQQFQIFSKIWTGYPWQLSPRRSLRLQSRPSRWHPILPSKHDPLLRLQTTP